MAVPFRAARTPSERSEFAQPDVALLLTTLSYYEDGLSREEMLEALQKLLGLGGSAKKSRYREWFQLSRGRLHPGECCSTLVLPSLYYVCMH